MSSYLYLLLQRRLHYVERGNASSPSSPIKSGNVPSLCTYLDSTYLKHVLPLTEKFQDGGLLNINRRYKPTQQQIVQQ
jgi:hypothetical protein